MHVCMHRPEKDIGPLICHFLLYSLESGSRTGPEARPAASKPIDPLAEAFTALEP